MVAILIARALCRVVGSAWNIDNLGTLHAARTVIMPSQLSKVGIIPQLYHVFSYLYTQFFVVKLSRFYEGIISEFSLSQ